MSKRRAAHESPKGQMRAIKRAMRDYGVRADQPVAELVEAVRDAALRELGFYDDDTDETFDG